MSDKQNLPYWESELFQILRFHANTTKVDIDFSSAFGEPSYSLKINYRGKDVFFHSGVTLWKRFKAATEFLQDLFGSNIYIYETM